MLDPQMERVHRHLTRLKLTATRDRLDALLQRAAKDEGILDRLLHHSHVIAIKGESYFVPGGVVVERYPDRFLIQNPGTLLVSLEQYHRGSVSECRNKALQQMFLMMGGGERAGSGVDRIWSGWRSRHWRAPKVTLHAQPDRVTLELTMVSLIPSGTLEFLAENLDIDVGSLSPLEIQALATAHLEGSVSNSRLQELASDHPTEITHCLQALCQRGWLTSDNRGRWSQYHLQGQTTAGPLFTDPLGEPTPLSPGKPEGDSLHNGQDSSHNREDSSHNREDSSHKAGNSLHSEEAPLIASEFPLGWGPEEEGRLRSIAAPIARLQRAAPTELRKAILALCLGRFLNVDQLADLLERNPQGLRNRHLTPMGREGTLLLRYPLAPNRPDQAYTAAKTGRPG